MNLSTPGIHHVTAVASDPQRTHDFYADTLGLRLVKRSVNQDDTDVYHLFYADHEGRPGTSMTLFPYPEAGSGRVGTGQVAAVSFLVPSGSLEYWRERLEEAGTEPGEVVDRFGDDVLPFSDPDGLPLELVARPDAPEPNLPESPVAHAHAIRGFFGVTLSLTGTEPTTDLLTGMGYRQADRSADGTRLRYETDGDLGYVVDVRAEPQAPRGLPGAGTVHHVAYRIDREAQEGWREFLIDRGLRPTEVIDRKWFESIYVREYENVLFEFATAEPGYTVDEDLEALGESLVLPEWLEDRRERIEASLPALST
ncbi:ring-cleaving dioxygenase [Halobiforma lacisalsi AJ5]|uniref:Glyoxalase/bleomycin resistance protein/dioxygenase n=1 Tax=Natronobacterium lacisalsi AJ5 TaxID=358396 RepID=M0LFH4_NATLA|nr:VOC family protein [Halobiforma lacisalsi]APW99170.1 ring-cleaving dioxygenase [Halobiforma lacisalsi AJ5]EMA30735.1 glyoxalase/bleomycin resistance protein/dioxygenase [Halobiforma lacisalsi AJ5]